MTLALRPMIKTGIASCAAIAPQARYDRMILVLSHMRAATTALSSVLCSHPSVSGYGETHVTHDGGLAPARVLVNLALRRAYAPGAPLLFDKILHDRLDRDAPEAFFAARCIFMARHPGAAVASICKLAAKTGMTDVARPDDAARYYLARLHTLQAHWQNLPPENRFGLSAESLLADPEGMIDRLGTWLRLTPVLRNEYVSHAATQKGGGGDPTRSASLTRIEARRGAAPLLPPVGVEPDLAAACVAAYDSLLGRFQPA